MAVDSETYMAVCGEVQDLRRQLAKSEARIAELSEALQVAVDTPELGGGTWYDMAVAALAEQAGR